MSPLLRRINLLFHLSFIFLFFFYTTPNRYYTFLLSTCTLPFWFSIVSMGGVMYNADRDGNKVTTVVATPGAGPDRPQEISYTDTKVIGNGSFGVVYLAKLCDTEELVAIKKVLQDKRFKVRETWNSTINNFLIISPVRQKLNAY